MTNQTENLTDEFWQISQKINIPLGLFWGDYNESNLSLTLMYRLPGETA